MPAIDDKVVTFPEQYRADEGFALAADGADPMARFREQYYLPQQADGRPAIYLCGNSLGPQPKATRELLNQELSDWARLGVDGHFKEQSPWYTYGELLRDSCARVVGALPLEVVVMNTLTVNLHLMLTTFYRPTLDRYRILMDAPPFPSDLYAVKSHLACRDQNVADALLLLGPRDGEQTLHSEDFESVLAKDGSSIAIVLLNVVNFFTGQFHDVRRIARAAKEHGCVVGLDLAHAVGNVPLALHDWEVDFAVWCNYKYMNAGPGAIGGCFVDEQHAGDRSLRRLAGWWGNDPATRFQMQIQQEFVPHFGADGWQISNPPILAMTPLRASLAHFDAAGMPALRAKSVSLTGYLEYLLQPLLGDKCEMITPREPARRGCQLSLVVHNRPRALLKSLQTEGVICDFRAPNVIRVAPAPLYNSFHEVWQFAQIMARNLG